MNSIEIDGTRYFYRTNWACLNELEGYYYTEFWRLTKQVQKRVWFKKVMVDEPAILFTIEARSTDPTLLKEWWRAEIDKKLQILKRQEELNQGKLI